ncbi:bifunctional nuclease family protein [Microbacterium sediminicola]|uniref:Bifunctional nuclease family protein n=1 Tax=Microbacterium sediminicola TaxID=415210 RepID=A0ABP4UN39_9MICO
MVEVRVAGVAIDSTGQHVILLKPVDAPEGEGSVVPIWIGAQEATSILVAVENATTPRPLAHDLMRSMIENLGATVARVEVTRIEEGTFFAEITLTAADGEHTIDARPSDAVALAARVGAAIEVAEAVFDEAGMPDMLGEADDEDAASEASGMPAGELPKVDDFMKFLDEVDPEDFRG